jgi:hypothetical protein
LQPVGAISGTVVDQLSGRPLSGATIRLDVDGRATSESILTDANGRFAFDDVPVGRVGVTATKHGWVRPSWRRGQPPRLFILSPGQMITDLRLVLRRGGSISGTIGTVSRNELPGATVTLLRCGAFGLCDIGNATVVQTTTTDERGYYRFYGLPDGAYLVGVNMQGGASSRPVLAMSREAIEFAIAQMKKGTNSLGAIQQSRLVRPVATVYPGTTNALEAQALEISDGEEHSGINFVAQMATTAKISGAIVGLDDRLIDVRLSVFPGERSLNLLPSTTVAVSGSTFQTSDLPPGTYRVGGRLGMEHWASSVVVLDGQDVDHISLAFQPTMEVRGRVVADQPGGSISELSGLQVTMRRADLSVTISTLDLSTATTDSSGTFLVRGVIPGRYEVTSSTPSRPGETWYVKSIDAGNGNLIDSPLDLIAGSEVPQLKIILTTRAAEVVGTVRDASGHPAPEFMLIVFPVDQKLWTSKTRRIASTSLSADGTFHLKGLPAGDYFAGLLGSNDARDVNGRALAEISQGAHRFTILEEVVTRLDLVVSGFATTSAPNGLGSTAR